MSFDILPAICACALKVSSPQPTRPGWLGSTQGRAQTQRNSVLAGVSERVLRTTAKHKAKRRWQFLALVEAKLKTDMVRRKQDVAASSARTTNTTL